MSIAFFIYPQGFLQYSKLRVLRGKNILAEKIEFQK